MSRQPSAPGSGAAAPTAAPDGTLLQRYESALRECGYRQDAAQLDAIRQLEALRERLETAHGGGAPRWLERWFPRRAAAVRGLYLYGAVGRGKTWLMDLFFASLSFPARRRHFHRFMHEVHADLAQLRRQRDPLPRLAQQLAGQARVLCFDELYVADIADAMLLGGLFSALLARGVTLVATSNVPPQELYRGGLQRERFLPAIALLERELDVVQLGGTTDYRLRQLSAAGIYLPSGAPDTAARLAALFDALGGKGAQRGGMLQVNGRDIPVQRLAHGAVWFDFATLCAGVRSTEDYIEIAREFQTVLLAEVPVLGAEADNAARRFIALVDEFYERNVKLIVSAAAPPTALYRGVALQALYARTASRLTEMQSEQYLAREHRA